MKGVMSVDLKMNGKTALVAASSKGLGNAIAKALANEGANVMLSGRHEADLKKLRKSWADSEADLSHIKYAILQTPTGSKRSFKRPLTHLERSICSSTMSEDRREAACWI